MNNYYNAVAKNNSFETRLFIFLISCLALFFCRATAVTSIDIIATTLTTCFSQETASQTDYVFDTIFDLSSNSSLKKGDIVKTNGYHTSGDGGAATYQIISSSDVLSDTPLFISLENGLYAQLIVSNNTIIAEQFGAYGDGIHDDSYPIQQIISLGYNLELSPKRDYLFINNGIYIDSNTTVIGNDSTFSLNNSYNPQGNDLDHYFIRNRHGEKLYSFTAKDLTINVTFNDGKFPNQSFVVMSPLSIENIILYNVSINVNRSKNNVVCFWLNNGCNMLKIDDCNFVNKTTGAQGGTFWLTPKEDNQFNTFTNLKCAKITGSYIYGSSGDEVVAVWGTYSANVTFTDTTIIGDIAAPNRHTRVISVFSEGDNNINDFITFDNCTLQGKCNKTTKTCYYDSLIGAGSDYPSNKINIYFKGGSIDSSVYGPVIFPSLYNPVNVTRFDANAKSTYISFSGTNITSTSTITGANPYYYDTSAEYNVSAWDCVFNNCTITCNNAFSYVGVPDNLYFHVPDILIKNSTITVNNSHDFIYKLRSNAPIKLIIKNSTITAKGVTSAVTSKNIDANLTTQKNAINMLHFESSKLNGVAL